MSHNPNARLSGPAYAMHRSWLFPCPICGRKKRSQKAVAQHVHHDHPPNARGA